MQRPGRGRPLHGRSAAVAQAALAAACAGASQQGRTASGRNRASKTAEYELQRAARGLRAAQSQDGLSPTDAALFSRVSRRGIGRYLGGPKLELCRNLHYAQSLDKIFQPEEGGVGHGATENSGGGRAGSSKCTAAAAQSPLADSDDGTMPRRKAVPAPDQPSVSLGKLDFDGLSFGAGDGGVAGDGGAGAPAPPPSPPEATAAPDTQAALAAPSSSAGKALLSPQLAVRTTPPELAEFVTALGGHSGGGAGAGVLGSCEGAAAAGGSGGHAARRKMWSAWDANGNGMLSLAEVDRGVMLELQRACGPEAGDRLWRRYRPSYIRAFADARDAAPDRKLGKGGGLRGDDVVTPAEFRVLLSYLRIYATMYEVFAMVDGEGAGVDAMDDKKLSREEWGHMLGEFVAAGNSWAPFIALQWATVADFDTVDRDGQVRTKALPFSVVLPLPFYPRQCLSLPSFVRLGRVR
eukprot:SAG22_NODE_2309_length_2733_cov_5.173880_2_plen_465_part_00